MRAIPGDDYYRNLEQGREYRIKKLYANGIILLEGHPGIYSGFHFWIMLDYRVSMEEVLAGSGQHIGYADESALASAT